MYAVKTSLENPHGLVINFITIYQKSDKIEQKIFCKLEEKNTNGRFGTNMEIPYIAWGSQKATKTKGGVKVARGMSGEVATMGAARALILATVGEKRRPCLRALFKKKKKKDDFGQIIRN
jgi:hypothetical protein